MNTQLLDAIFTDGIQHPNFFNGRILTATDLRDEQTANLKRSRHLGRALGTGVVSGLQVEIADSGKALAITHGLAINPRGDTLALLAEQPDGKTTLALTVPDPLLTATQSPFMPCGLAGATPLSGSVPTGYYLLAITNATRLSVAMAPNSGLEGDRVGCTHRYEEIGVQFKLVPLTTADFVSLPAPGLKNRSRLAHRLLGTYELAPYAEDPVYAPTHYGLIDALRRVNRLTECDVPLALFRYQAQQVQFVDVWAVRRPCRQSCPDDVWGDRARPLVSQRRAIEAQAFLLQFQHHLAELRAQISGTIRAIDHFDYLPAAGYLPISSDSTTGFNVSTFFNPDRIRQVSLNTATIPLLFQQSFHTFPIDPAQDAIDLYPVTPHQANAVPYVIFMRRGLSPSLSISGGNCTYTLTPDNWEASLTQIANGVGNIHICLQPGTYTLTRPIAVKNKGHVKVTGAGNGTRLRSHNAEAALYFENCQSVTVRDLYAENSTARSPQPTRRLQGTLSFYNCADVTVENTDLKCVGAARKTAACITVSPLRKQGQGTDFTADKIRIQNCDLEVGDRQIGILLVNTRYAQVENNRIIALRAQNPASQGIVVGGAIAQDIRILQNRVENSLQGIHIGVSHREPAKGEPDRIENLLILGNTLHLALPNISSQGVNERHGIFVGNCNSLVIENNLIGLTRFNNTLRTPIQGIQIYGFLGRRIVIRQNQLTSLNALSGFLAESIQLTDLSSQPATPLIENNFIS